MAPECLAPGVACIGHPAAESGVGEALRGTARALAAANIPFTLLGLPQFTTARLQDRSMAAHESPRLGSRANLLCDGLIGADVAVRALGDAPSPAGPISSARSGNCRRCRRASPRACRASRRFGRRRNSCARPSPRRERSRDSHASSRRARRDRAGKRAAFGLPEEATLFLFCFDPSSFVERKNPLAAVEAFHRAFGEHGNPEVGLVIKIFDPGPHAGALKQLQISDRRRSAHSSDREDDETAEMNGLLAVADAFVSLHRSEGFGFGLAEAMLLGKPAIGTDYSGNPDFLTDGDRPSSALRAGAGRLRRIPGPRGSSLGGARYRRGARIMAVDRP